MIETELLQWVKTEWEVIDVHYTQSEQNTILHLAGVEGWRHTAGGPVTLPDGKTSGKFWMRLSRKKKVEEPVEETTKE